MVAVTRVQKALKGVDYPATKDQLLEAAQRNGADDDVVDVLTTVHDRQFEGPSGVMKALGGQLGGSD